MTSKTATASAPARPRVSVVMACHNAAATVAAAVEHVAGQDFRELELVVVDDGSSDASLHILTGLSATHPGLVVIGQEHAGAEAARNRGVEAARGDWLTFLDPCQRWTRHFIGKLVCAAEEASADLAYCGWRLPAGPDDARGEPVLPRDYSAEDLELVCFSDCPWPLHAALVRRRIVMEAGGFDTTLRCCSDHDLWLRIARRLRVVRVPDLMATLCPDDAGGAPGDPLSTALDRLRLQEDYLASQPEFAYRVGRERMTTLTLGRIRTQAYQHLEARRLPVARRLFQLLLERGALRWRDVRPALIACLPGPWLEALTGRGH